MNVCVFFIVLMGFPGGSDSKVSACNAGDPGSIPGLGRSPGEGNGNPLPISRGKRSSMPQPKTRPDSPVPSLQGPCDRSLKSEEP